jgi:putative tricarboxylic transport membrane protein
MRALFLGLLLTVALPVAAERMHFVIPAGPGGGLDATARAIGQVLMAEKLVPRVSYENRSGGGGGKAMAYFVESGAVLEDTLLVNSTPLLVRSLQGLFPQSHRDLTPVAGLIADPAVVAVRSDSPFEDWSAVAAALVANPAKLFVGGGSVKGSLDHIVTSLLAGAVGVSPRAVRYLPYDGGGKAMLALLSGEAQVLVSGLGETISQHQSGSVRVLAVATAERSPQLPDVPTFTELGTEVVFSNWRGVFAPKTVDADTLERYIETVSQAVASEAWQRELDRYGWQPQFVPGPEFGAYLEEQERELRTVLVELGLVR